MLKRKKKLRWPGLYKRISLVHKVAKCQQMYCMSTCYFIYSYLLMFGHLSNATKRCQMKPTFADGCTGWGGWIEYLLLVLETQWRETNKMECKQWFTSVKDCHKDYNYKILRRGNIWWSWLKIPAMEITRLTCRLAYCESCD